MNLDVQKNRLSNKAFQNPFEELFSKRRGKIKPGLERISEARKRMGYPLSGIPQILIAGTNGKGSTAGWIAKLADAAELHVGIFSSPHLISFTERFQSNQKDISEAFLVHLIEQMKESLGVFFSTLTFFEISTLLAMVVFEEISVDLAIIEVGLGGRWDASNCLEPEVSVVTSIGLDHTEWLGDTEQKILIEKIQIAREGRPLVLGRGILENLELKNTLNEQTRLLKTQPVYPVSNHLVASTLKSLRLNKWQIENICVALSAISRTKQLQNYSDSPSQIDLLQKVIKKPFWPNVFNGRNQQLIVKTKSGSRVFRLDIGHNLQAVENFLEGLPNEAAHGVALVSILADKDLLAIIRKFKDYFDRLILFGMDLDRCDVTLLKSIATKEDVEYTEDFHGAWQLAKTTSQEKMISVAGSFGAVGNTLEYFDARIQFAKPFHTYFVGRDSI